MKKELLFDKSKTVGENLLNIIRDNGYTKSSFAKAISITRITLDRLLIGEIENLTEFRQYIEKISGIQGITEEQLMNYIPKFTANNETGCIASNDVKCNDQSGLVHSFNTLENHEIKSSAKEMFSILDDILNICEVYYAK